MVMLIDELPVPEKIREILKSNGIQELYPPQEEAINAGLLKSNQNFVIATPTSSGKTLLSELVMIKEFLEGGKSIYSVPLRALANERLEDFSKWIEIGARVTITTGDYDISPQDLSRADIIVTTNERLDSIIRHNPDWLPEVRVVTFDEFHLVGVPKRGAVLEGVVTLLRRMIKPRILALSATINNAEEIANWLDAKLIRSSWRPVKLVEGIIDLDGKQKLLLNETPAPLLDTEFYGALDVLQEGGQVIVFQPSRKSAVEFAKKIAPYVAPYLTSEERESLRDAVRKLDHESITAKELISIIPQGAAFHTAALDPESRKTVEKLFISRKLKVISSTPTLSAGVNLPARCVIIASLYRYEFGRNNPISRMEYKQMSGRAGRPRFDSIGYSYIVARNKRMVEMAREYISSDPEPVYSQFDDLDTFRSFILSVLSLGKTNESTLKEILNDTFYIHQRGKATLDYLFPLAVNDLISWEMVKRTGDILSLTRLGQLVAMLYLPPEAAHRIVKSLPNARTEDDYLILTSSCNDIDYLPLTRKAVLMFRRLNIEPYSETSIAVAAVLKMWIEEKTIGEIEKELDVSPGDLHRIVETAEWVCYSISRIAHALGYDDIVPSILTQRIKDGIREELIPLVRIPQVGRVRARTLYNAGIKTPRDVVLHGADKIMSLPGFSEKLATSIVNAAKEIMT